MLVTQEDLMIARQREMLRHVTAFEVRDALRQMQAGTYGICSSCGGEIPEARLQARPEATRCIDCQLEFERLCAC